MPCNHWLEKNPLYSYIMAGYSRLQDTSVAIDRVYFKIITGWIHQEDRAFNMYEFNNIASNTRDKYRENW